MVVVLEDQLLSFAKFAARVAHHAPPRVGVASRFIAGGPVIARDRLFRETRYVRLGSVASVIMLLLLVVPPARAQQAAPGPIVEDFTEERLGAAPTSFSTPTGFWSIGTNGQDAKPVLYEDGTQWEGSQTANTLASQARALYGDRWNEFVDDLPKTLTGKIRRIELRQRDAAASTDG